VNYLESLVKHKLLNPKTALGSISDRIDLTNLVIDEYGDSILLDKEFINLLYFKVILQKTSLYFYKASHHLSIVLDALSKNT